MKSPLETAADAAREVLAKIEDVSHAVKADIEACETNLDDLYETAEVFCREIVDTLQQQSDPVALATTEAIDNLIALLTEAKTYYATGENGAAFGTLLMFEEYAADLNAAIRLCRMAAKRRAQ